MCKGILKEILFAEISILIQRVQLSTFYIGYEMDEEVFHLSMLYYCLEAMVNKI